MFLLTLKINGKEEFRQSPSQQRMIGEVLRFFDSKDADIVPLPFKIDVNKRGQIVGVYFENFPDDKWWLENHPVRGDFQAKITAEIIKIDADIALEKYEIPRDFIHGDGPCWVAIKNSEVVRLVYSNSIRTTTDTFSELKDKAFNLLRHHGRVCNGSVSGKFFIPVRVQNERVPKKTFIRSQLPPAQKSGA